jgi:hypothetical protein
MKRSRSRIIVCLVLALPLAACGRSTSTAVPALPTQVAMPTWTPTAQRTYTSTPVALPTPAPSSTFTPAPTTTPTVAPTSSPTPFLPGTLVSPADLRQPVGPVLWYRDDGLWLVDPETGDRQRAQMGAEAAAWSPHGDYLAVLEPPLPGQKVLADVRVLTVYDLATQQRHTYPNVQLAPHSGIAWQKVDDALVLYAIPAEAPACLLRMDPARGEFEHCAPRAAQTCTLPATSPP